MLPLLLKTHIWESNIWNGLEWCLQKRQPAPTPCRLSAFVFLLQEQRTGVGMPAAGWGLGKAEAQGREWWVCNVCGCHWSEGPAGGTGSLQWAASLRLRRGNRGRVENNRTRQWHWDNLWSYLGIFNWPVSFSHLMHFHKDFSLPLVLSSRSSLDFPTDSLSGFLCFVSPLSHCKAALSCLALWYLSRKTDSAKELFGKASCYSQERNLVREGWLSVT